MHPKDISALWNVKYYIFLKPFVDFLYATLILFVARH